MSRNWALPVQVGCKRLLDIAVSAILLVLLSPLMLMVALAIKLDSPGPVLYPWNVVGRSGKPFRSWKLRSMYANADASKQLLLSQNEMQGPVFKLRNDPRITRCGRLLRRYSLDELPQLWSVLIGDMSLVGPRPPLQSEYQEFSTRQKRKLMVKPGITCLWQVCGRNDICDFNDWVKLDMKYIREWSFWLDCKILAKTLSAVARGSGR